MITIGSGPVVVPARGPTVVFHTPESAAPLLSLSPVALRARLRRAARRVRGEVVADLGGGVVGVKLGRSWRIRLDNP